MKTAYYTFTTWNNGGMAAGFGGAVDAQRQAAMFRQPEQGSRGPAGEKIVDLTAWRAANLESWEEPLDEAQPPEEPGGELPEAPAPRARKSHRAMLTAELISTLSVVAVAAVLIVRVLTF